MNINPSNNAQTVVNCPRHRYSMDQLCVWDGCTFNTIMCHCCRLEQHPHPQHVVCHIKDFYEYASNLKYDRSVETLYEAFIAKFKAVKIDLIRQIQESRKKLNELEAETIRYVESIESAITSEVESYARKKQYPFVYNPNQELPAFQSDMNKQIVTLLAARQLKKSLNLKLEKLPTLGSEVDNERLELLRKINSDIEQIKRSLRPQSLLERFEEVRKKETDFGRMSVNPTKPQTAYRPQMAPEGPPSRSGSGRFDDNAPQKPVSQSNNDIPVNPKIVGTLPMSHQDMSANEPQKEIFLSKWSQTMKHKDIEFSNNNVIYRHAVNSDYECCCLMEDALSSGSNYFWKFRVGDIKGNGSLLVGVCDVQAAAKCDYELSNTFTGHGFYLVSSNGREYHSDNPSENEASISFNFRKDDEVCLEYKPSRKELIVSKNNKKQSFRIQGIKKPLLGTLKGVVFLKGCRDCILLRQTQ